MTRLCTIAGCDIELVRGALVYSAGFAVDADGAPHAYHPVSARGLDNLDNAKSFLNEEKTRFRWVGIATRDGVPIIQGDEEPAPGFYVSPTALGDPAYPITDARRYVDSETVPYIAISKALRHSDDQPDKPVRLGDLAMVQCGHRMSWAIVADVGPKNRIGEGSIALAKLLGINPSARNGGCEGGVKYIIFTNSSTGWPRPDAAEKAQQLYMTWLNASNS